MKLTLEKQIPLVFFIAILLLGIIFYFAFSNVNRLKDALGWQKHTREVLLTLDEIVIASVDIETNGRGFLITGNDGYLESFDEAQLRFDQNLIKLQEQVKDNNSQLDRIPKLKETIDARLDLLRTSVNLRRTMSLEDVRKQIPPGRARELMISVRQIIDEMKNEERNLLANRESELNDYLSTTYQILLVSSIAGLILLILANIAILREIKKRRVAESELRDANKDLEKRVEERTQELSNKNDELKDQIRQREYSENRHRIALEAGKLGTWMLDPHTNKSEIDERGLSLFGFSADDFSGDVFGRVYEEDSAQVRELFQKSLSENLFFNAEFRVLDKEGNFRWNNCVGQPVLDESGKVGYIVGNCRDVTDLKENENVIRQSEIFRRAILDSLSAHIAVLDKEGNIVAVNNAWEKFAVANCDNPNKLSTTGIGQNYLKVCEDSDTFDENTIKIIDNLKKVLSGEINDFTFEYPCHSPEEERWFLLQVTSLKNDEGGAVVSHIDISDRKKNEAKLKNSEEFARTIFESSPDSVIVLETDGRMHSINSTGLRLMEIDDFASLIGKNWIDFWEDDEKKIAVNAIKQAFEGKSIHFEGFRRTVKGTPKWWDVTVAPVFNDQGKTTLLVSNSREITDRKKAEIELKNSEEFARSIFENSPDCVKILELNGTLHSMNKNGLCIMEIENFDDYIGKQWVEFWQGDENELAYQAVQSASQGKSVSFEGFCLTAKGTPKWWDVSVAPIFDREGKPIRLISTSRDITERREAEREREQLFKNEQAARKDAEIANRLRDEFLATVSHELRAPLNSILGWGRLLEKGNLDEKTSKKAIETIVRNADSQNRLIEDLLDVSRIISGKLRLEIITINPINFVEAALETVRPAAEAKNIKLEIKQDSVISHISGDPNRLQQVVWNLLSNAIKFTPNGGQVTVEIERMNGHIDIRVRDTGVGISQEFLPHVFDRFRQADASSIRKFGGLGLGLAIVRHIAEMHGGIVYAFSEGENKGSTFTISLPVTSTPKEEKEISPENNRLFENTPKLSLDGLLILVVDDEEDTRQLLVQSLTFYGATVITAKSAKEGLSVLQETNPDILVSDIGMPDEDGYSFIKKIRALENEHQKNTIAVALTAFTRAQDRMRALAAGFQNHVGKPVEPDELATVIASLTGRLKMEDE